MNLLYSFEDYEEAYYHMRYYDCKKIGCYLLQHIKNDRAKELYKKLEAAEYSWDMSQKDAETFSKLLSDVKIWIMVHLPL